MIRSNFLHVGYFVSDHPLKWYFVGTIFGYRHELEWVLDIAPIYMCTHDNFLWRFYLIE